MDREKTHEKRLAVADSEKELCYFFGMKRSLFFAIRFWLFCCNFHTIAASANEVLKRFEVSIHIPDPEFRYAIEVRRTHIMV